MEVLNEILLNKRREQPTLEEVVEDISSFGYMNFSVDFTRRTEPLLTLGDPKGLDVYGNPRGVLFEVSVESTESLRSWRFLKKLLEEAGYEFLEDWPLSIVIEYDDKEGTETIRRIGR